MAVIFYFSESSLFSSIMHRGERRSTGATYCRIMSLLLACLMAVPMAGCGQENKLFPPKVDAGKSNVASVSPLKVDTSFVNTDILTNVRRDPSTALQSFAKLEPALQTALGDRLGPLDTDDLFAIYCAILSFNLAPYGTSTVTALPDLLKEPQLDCDNYVLLMAHLFRLNRPQSTAQIRIVGWHGGIVGNHAQLFFINVHNHRSLMLDPTIGIAVNADFDQIASGKQIDRSKIIDFSSRTDLQQYQQKIVVAIADGQYRPSDLLYYFDSVEHFLRHVINEQEPWPPDWATPGGMILRRDVRSGK